MLFEYIRIGLCIKFVYNAAPIVAPKREMLRLFSRKDEYSHVVGKFRIIKYKERIRALNFKIRPKNSQPSS